MDGKTTEITSADSEALTTIANGINNLKAFDYASYHLAEQDLANTDDLCGHLCGSEPDIPLCAA